VIGDQLVIMADINEDVKGANTQKNIQQLGLIEALYTITQG